MKPRTIKSGYLIPIILTLFLVGCAKAALHPGAVSPLDSQAYDALLAAQTAIDQTRLQLEGGQIPAQFTAPTKTALNAAIGAYNITRDSWLLYRHESQAAGGGSVSSAQAAQLQNDLTQLASAIASVSTAKGGK